MNHHQRIALAKKALQGTSIGDAFGESFFGERKSILQHLANRTIPSTSWEFTDDTVMAIALFEQLEKHRTIIQNDLAEQLAIKHDLDPNRGYGATARRILRNISAGEDWQTISKNVFDGMGSMGNGASMRVCPIGAYFYDDLEQVKTLAKKSAEITHYNIEGITGAIAVAVATAINTNHQINGMDVTPNEFIQLVANELPDTDLKSKILKSLTVSYSYHIDTIKRILGNGVKILATDTVPFAIWCAAYHQNDFEKALWKAVSILGDRDTICAIVGGITIMRTDKKGIPKLWSNSVEDYESSIFRT